MPVNFRVPVDAGATAQADTVALGADDVADEVPVAVVAEPGVH